MKKKKFVSILILAMLLLMQVGYVSALSPIRVDRIIIPTPVGVEPVTSVFELELMNVYFNQDTGYLSLVFEDNDSQMLADSEPIIASSTKDDWYVVFSNASSTNTYVSQSLGRLTISAKWVDRTYLPRITIYYGKENVSLSTIITSINKDGRTYKELFSKQLIELNQYIESTDVGPVLNPEEPNDKQTSEFLSLDNYKELVGIPVSSFTELNQYYHDYFTDASSLALATISESTFSTYPYAYLFNGTNYNFIILSQAPDYSNGSLGNLNGNQTYHDGSPIMVTMAGQPSWNSYSSGYLYTILDLYSYNFRPISSNEPTTPVYSHNIELLTLDSEENKFYVEVYVDNRQCPIMDNVHIYSNASINDFDYQYKYALDYTEYMVYKYMVSFSLPNYGEQLVDINLNYEGNEIATASYTVNNTGIPPNIDTDDRFYLRTYDDVVEFVYETHNGVFKDSITGFSLVNNETLEVVKSYPTYQKTFTGELTGYANTRYQYRFVFPMDVFANDIYMKGKITFSDATEAFSVNMIDYQSNVWGGETIVEVPTEDPNEPPITQEEVEQATQDYMEEINQQIDQTQAELEEGSFGQGMRTFLGQNWLFILGVVVIGGYFLFN